MSLTHRLHQIATSGCLIASLFLVLSSEGRAQVNASAPTRQAQQEQTAPAPPQVAQERIPKSNYYKVNCEQPMDHEAADLCEQRRQAQAAEDAVWWSAFQTKVGIAGFGAVVLSLIFTGWAAVAAGRAARAAEAAVAVATRTAEQQLRAYMSISLSSLSDFDVGKHPIGGVTVTNKGQTPAHHVMACLALVLEEAPVVDFSLGDAEYVSKSDVGPDDSILPTITASVPLTREAREEIITGKLEFYLYGRVTYRDVFDRERTTDFRLMLTPDHVKTGNHIWSVCPEGNHAT